MPIAEARIETGRASRYLVQLCRHATAMGGEHGHRPRIHGGGASAAMGEVRVHAEWSDTHAVVEFAPWGRCTAQADADALLLRIEATDEENLRRIQDVISRDFGRFGRQDRLTVAWRRVGIAGIAEGPGASDASGAPDASPVTEPMP